MKIMNRLKFLGAGALLAALIAAFSAVPASAQAVLAQTTLSAALSGNATSTSPISLTSATGVVTALNGQPVTIAYVDTEAIGIMNVLTGQTTVFTVQRGMFGTRVESHAANAVVYIQVVTPQSGGFSGAGGLELNDPPAQSSCPAASQNVLPWINMTTGNVWNCQAYFTPAGNSITAWVPSSYPGSPNTNAPFTVWAPSAAAYTNATTSFTSVTGLSFYALPDKNYQATCHIVWQGSAGTTGPKYEFTGPSSPTAVAIGGFLNVTDATYLSLTSTAFGTGIANNGTITTATNFADTVTLGVVNGANGGVVQLKAAADGTGTLTIQPGSYCAVQ